MGLMSSFFVSRDSAAGAVAEDRIGGVDIEGGQGELDESDAGGGRGDADFGSIETVTFCSGQRRRTMEAVDDCCCSLAESFCVKRRR